MHKFLVIAAALLLVCFGVFADDKNDEKIDAKKLVGNWQQKGTEIVVEFAKDGKASFLILGQNVTPDTTWKIDGNKLLLMDEKGLGKGEVFTMAILKLAGTELKTKDGSGKVEEFSRIKDR